MGVHAPPERQVSPPVPDVLSRPEKWDSKFSLESVPGRVGAEECDWEGPGRWGGVSEVVPASHSASCQAPPQIRPFHQDDFLRSLEHAGPQLTCILKGDWLGLYRWVDSRQGPEILAAGG